jgi:glycosyltransferase involved in cell wall biosynthesis
MLQIAHYRPEGEAGAVIVSHVVNTGYGAAIRTCFNYAKENNFDVMVILDGDGQYDPSFILEFINQTLGKFDQKCFAESLGKFDQQTFKKSLTKNALQASQVSSSN